MPVAGRAKAGGRGRGGRLKTEARSLKDSVLAIDTRAFELIGKLRLKSEPSLSANGALFLNPGHRPGSLESNRVVRPEGPR